MEFLIPITLAVLALVAWQARRPPVVCLHLYIVIKGDGADVVDGEEWKRLAEDEE